MRIKNPLIAFLFLLLCGAVISSWGACPLLVHSDPSNQREFQNVCQDILLGPQVTTGSGAPKSIPRKVGDTYIDTTNTHVYTATATATSASWLQVK